MVATPRIWALTASLVSRSQAALNPAVASVSTSFSTIRTPTRVPTGGPEVRHLLVTDLRCLGEIVQGQRAADSATLAVHSDLQQPPAKHLRCLFAGTFPSDPWAIGDPLFDVFSHAPLHSGRDR